MSLTGRPQFTGELVICATMKPSKYSRPCSMSTPAFKLCSVVQTYCLQDKSAQVTEKEEPAGNSVMVVTIPIQCCFHLKVQQEVTVKISFINRVVLLQKIKIKKNTKYALPQRTKREIFATTESVQHAVEKCPQPSNAK